MLMKLSAKWLVCHPFCPYSTDGAPWSFSAWSCTLWTSRFFRPHCQCLVRGSSASVSNSKNQDQPWLWTTSTPPVVGNKTSRSLLPPTSNFHVFLIFFFLGYSKKELVGKNVKVLMTAKRAALHDSYLQNYLKTGIKKVIGVGRSVDVKAKDETVMRCLLTVTEHFQGTNHPPYPLSLLFHARGGALASNGVCLSFYLILDMPPQRIPEPPLHPCWCLSPIGCLLIPQNHFPLWSPPLLPFFWLLNSFLSFSLGGVPFFMGTLDQTTGDISSSHDASFEQDPFALFDNLLDATVVIGFDGIIAYTNNAVSIVRPPSLPCFCPFFLPQLRVVLSPPVHSSLRCFPPRMSFSQPPQIHLHRIQRSSTLRSCFLCRHVS